LNGHPLFGSIFETFIVSEFYKRIHHISETPPFYFWRDKTGNEVDLIVDLGSTLIPIEIKASKTYHPEFKSNITSWMKLKGNTARKGYVIYRGDQIVGKRSDVSITPWWTM
jgi:predicted AAA+ superfamily ATPase